MNLLTILYWVILVLAVVFSTVLSWAPATPLALLALFVIIGIRSFRTSIS